MNNMQVVTQSQIDGEFVGFNDEMIFKLSDGSYWIQDAYKYWYCYAYCPKVQILRSNSRQFLQVIGQSEMAPVRQITDVVESRINGEFKGWDGESIYRLVNGQTWQQTQYKYVYKYAHMPEVIIFNAGSGHVMQVSGTSARVRRIG